MTHADAVRERRLVLREFLASALYLALVLLAVLVAAPDDRLPAEGPLVGLLVGAAIGRTFAHWPALSGAAIARVGGRSWPWVVVAGVVAFGVAVVVVAVKNAAGH